MLRKSGFPPRQLVGALPRVPRSDKQVGEPRGETIVHRLSSDIISYQR